MKGISFERPRKSALLAKHISNVQSKHFKKDQLNINQSKSRIIIILHNKIQYSNLFSK